MEPSLICFFPPLWLRRNSCPALPPCGDLEDFQVHLTELKNQEHEGDSPSKDTLSKVPKNINFISTLSIQFHHIHSTSIVFGAFSCVQLIQNLQHHALSRQESVAPPDLGSRSSHTPAEQLCHPFSLQMCPCRS